MNGRLVLLAFVLLAAEVACGRSADGSRSPTDVVARVASRQVTYAEIRCKPEVPPSRCSAAEQAELDRILASELIAAAARIYGVVPTSDEVDAAVAAAAPGFDEFAHEQNRKFQALARAVLQVQQGASVDEVFDSELSPLGITRATFEEALRDENRGQVAAALGRDLAAEAVHRITQEQRQRLILRRLDDLAGARARERGITPERAWLDMWRDVIRRTDTRIIDPAFSLPDMERY